MYKSTLFLLLTNVFFLKSNSIKLGGVSQLKDYPCIGKETILTQFDTRSPDHYNMILVTKNLDDLAEPINIKFTFDTAVNIPNRIIKSKRSFEIDVLKSSEKNISFTVEGVRAYPNLISVKIAGDEHCNDGIKKDVWKNYLTFKPITLQSINDECGKRKKEHREYIVGGESTSEGDWPWHVALYRFASDRTRAYICGGTIISKLRILTAAHCVYESGSKIPAERLLAVLGQYNYWGGDSGEQVKKVYEIVTHSEFSKKTLANDIAILKLLTEITFTSTVQPICLWNKDVKDKSDIVGQSGYVIGWGATGTDKFSEYLKLAVMPIFDDLDCIKTNQNFFGKYLTHKSFCAGFKNGTAPCNGDSGGGLHISINDVWHQRGIVSLGVATKDQDVCDPKYLTIFTDVGQFLDFIEDNLE